MTMNGDSWMFVRLAVLVIIGASKLIGSEPSPDTLVPAVATVPISNLIDKQELFVSGENGTHTYRIPALITALNGDLIAVCDARQLSAADLIGNRDIDIVFRRSHDNGKTWTPRTVLCNYEPGQSASDPSLILDNSTGDIFCFYNFMDHDHAKKIFRFYMQRSCDHGKTWEKAVDVTEQITPATWATDFKFITSGRGVQTHDGLLIHTIVNLKRGLHVFGSRDHGETWSLMSGPIQPADEAKIIELGDGAWMINARVNTNDHCRWLHLSRDHGQTWKSAAERDLVDPGCNASILRYSSALAGNDKNMLLFCNANSSSGRKNLSMHVSYDDGKTWPIKKVIDAGPAAYASITVCKDGTIGVFYEPGYKSMRFVRFTVADLTDQSGFGKE